MGRETRPKDYPKLKRYKPSHFMLPTSHSDKTKADRAVNFIENLCHTKGKWSGKRFWFLPWQEQLIRDIFGIVKVDGYRQFRTAFVEICKMVGKSELAAGFHCLRCCKTDGGNVTSTYETFQAGDSYKENCELWECRLLPGAVSRGRG